MSYLAASLGIIQTQNLGSYLGFPLKHSGRNTQAYDFIVDKLLRKLVGWKSKFLSFPTRTLLIKTVMASISAYVMQCVALLVSTCNRIDSIQRDFLWGY